jgi:DNA topoisomerase-3
MKLIITEKPSVAKEIALAVGALEVGTGYLKNNEYTITWAFGHLLEIDNKTLLPDSEKWDYERLPIIPKEFTYTVIPKVVKQFNIIKALIKKSDSIIISTDAAREGELIARLILNHSGWTNWNKTFRFWTSEALTKSVVLKCLNNLQPAANFDDYYFNALTRQHADWILGINLSRAVSLKVGSGKWSVGRVQSPTLRLIVDRDNLRSEFKPIQYFVLKGVFSYDHQNYEGFYINNHQNDKTVKTIDEEEVDEIDSKLSKIQTEHIINELFNTDSGLIESIKTKDKSESPPLLHSLTSLQREANQIYGYSAQQTLDLTQSLYEKHKCLSYPRTNSNYMAESSKELVISILRKLNNEKLLNRVETVGNRVFNDEKLTDHHAIIPLNDLPSVLNEEQYKKEKNIYVLVYRKFLGAFMEDYQYETTEIITNIKEFKFKTVGKVTTLLGWKSLYSSDDKTALPKLKEGFKVKKEKLDVIERFTKPPLALNDSSILGLMEKYNLGTTATMADTIETLIARNYVIRDKKNIISTEKGRELILKLTGRQFIDVELTSFWEHKLESYCINKSGKKGYEEFIREVSVFVTEEVENIKHLNIKSISVATPKMLSYALKIANQHKFKLESNSFEYISGIMEKYKDVTVSVGKCLCGNDITETLSTWTCKCGKTVWKTAFKKKLTLPQGIAIFNGKKVALKGLQGKNKKFDAVIFLNSDNKSFGLEFDNKLIKQ